MWIALYVLITHWVCDFVIQRGDMIAGIADKVYIKNHCVKYAIAFPASLIILATFLNCSFLGFLLFCAIAVGTHTLIDAFAIPTATHAFSIREYKTGFVLLGLDQLLHVSALLFSLPLLQ